MLNNLSFELYHQDIDKHIHEVDLQLFHIHQDHMDLVDMDLLELHSRYYNNNINILDSAHLNIVFCPSGH